VDSIRQAIELARGQVAAQRASFSGIAGGLNAFDTAIADFRLSPAHLESTRIVAHNGSSPHGRYFDMLRTQVLQEFDRNSWQFLAVTSPTAGCGKTVTACNLALSIARLPERSVLLVDFDLQKPKVSEYLGLKREQGVLSVLEGAATLPETVVRVSMGRTNMLVLPGEVCQHGSSEWMASQTMSTLLQAIRTEFRSRIVIFDLPPILVGDDVLSILPHMDATLFVAAVGSTSVAQIKECKKHLKGTSVVRMVVNKATEPNESYYAYY
jgi:Mrp family chromosome partitioning ATPase